MINGFEDLQKVGTENVNKALESFGAFSKGLQAIAAESADYSKKAFDEAAGYVERLLGVRSIDRAVEVQADYLKTSYEAAVGQATKVGELYADVAKAAMKPFDGYFPATVK